jgi:hypothetical protein
MTDEFNTYRNLTIGHLIRRRIEVSNMLDDAIRLHDYKNIAFSDLVLEEHRLISQITEFDNKHGQRI